MWYIILLLLPFCACAWAMFNLRGQRVNERRLIMVFTLLCMASYFFIQYYLDVNGYYPFRLSKLLHDMCAIVFLPMGHLYVCMCLGITKKLRFFQLTIALGVLLIPDLISMLMMPAGNGVMLREDMYNYVCLQFGQNFTVRIQFFTIVILLQSIIILQRVLVMRRILVVRNLFLTPGAKAVVYLAVGTCVWAFLTILPPHSFYAHPVANAVLLTSYSLIATLLIVLLTLFFDQSVVHDSEDNIVSLENDSDSQLAEDILTVIERDKVYLNPALRLDDLASMLMTNRTYVARAFRLKFNGTFTEVMNYYRLEHAKMLMLNEQKMRMESVATASGFSSANFFGRVFKAAEGMTPTAWRRAKLGVTTHAHESEESHKAEGMTTAEALGEPEPTLRDVYGSADGEGSSADEILPPPPPRFLSNR